MNNTDLIIGVLTVLCTVGWLALPPLVAVIYGLTHEGEYDD